MTPNVHANVQLMVSLQFILASVAKRPDVYLSELVNDLKDLSGVTTNRASVWRALKDKGYSHKKVLSPRVYWS